jgi:porphobilinogen synthase
MFVCPGEGVRVPIDSMPGVCNLSVDLLVEECREAAALGVPGVILFGIPPHKDPMGSGGYDEQGIVQGAIRALKRELPQLLVIADTCLCEYTDHGHCGLVEDGDVHNDKSLALLSRAAVSQAQAGADIIAPSDMMDGRVGAIRTALDQAGLERVPILSYAAKYSSSFYGPFRDAAQSAPQFGDRKTYQMDPANHREAMREIQADINEGADMIMVKPALPYLDVLWNAKQEFGLPTAAYQVSGEYAMLQAASANGWLDAERAVLESLTCIKRAGADFILTYYALQAARLLG